MQEVLLGVQGYQEGLDVVCILKGFPFGEMQLIPNNEGTT